VIKVRWPGVAVREPTANRPTHDVREFESRSHRNGAVAERIKAAVPKTAGHGDMPREFESHRLLGGCA
jgi:hypothetical protein